MRQQVSLDAMETVAPVYDAIGHGYEPVRRPDPRIASRITEALGDVRTVLNIGAGTGSYEPSDRWVLAVEPSMVMIQQRPQGSAPVLQASAETLTLADKTVDAAMGVLTIHHWNDLERGIQQLVRVARERIVIVTMDVPTLAELWIVKDYFPDFVGKHTDRFPSMEKLCGLLPNATAEVLPVPHDCTDCFTGAMWARPQDLLDPVIQAASSTWRDLSPEAMNSGLSRLQHDLENGTWTQRYGHLLQNDTLDVGLRIVTSRPNLAVESSRSTGSSHPRPLSTTT